ncbi:hypothetical protein [Catenulispora pinisilvae]|uniref:hypothetical protein n=1 Tax=Catenulispora pinisilvae TaxID=2705253 RepID=UPI0018927063|nr:hypothetical protein [Catenulispora pinisilvae]
MDWYPESGETPLFRGVASFASGRAPMVAGKRWFRDDQGRDISAELVGWPPAPAHEKKGEKAAKAGRGLGILGKATAVVVAGTVELLSPGGGSNVNVKGPDGAHPTDPALEVEDFPVLWAAAGSTARTAPYQLDPDRRPDRSYRTDLQLTDQRLLVLGSASVQLPAEVVWDLPLDRVAGAVQHAFATHGADVTVTFTDGSWVRLDLGSKGSAAKVVAVLSGATEPVALNPAQQAAVDSWSSALPKPVEFVVNSVDAAAGIVSVEAKAHVGKKVVNAGSITLDAAGKPVLG